MKGHVTACHLVVPQFSHMPIYAKFVESAISRSNSGQTDMSRLEGSTLSSLVGRTEYQNEKSICDCCNCYVEIVGEKRLK